MFEQFIETIKTEFRMRGHIPDAIRVRNVGEFCNKIGIERSFSQIASNEVPVALYGLNVFESPYMQKDVLHLLDKSGKIIKVVNL